MKTVTKKKEFPTEGRATTSDVCEFLNISPTLLRKLCDQGCLKCSWAGTHRRFSWSYIRSVLDGKEVVPGINAPMAELESTAAN